MRRRVVVLLAVLVLAGCGAGDGASGPSPDNGGHANGRASVDPTDGPLTIEQAREGGAAGPVEVRGYLLAERDSVRLCDGLLESYPPQCGGASLRVDGIDLTAFMTQTAGDVMWTDAPVTLAGEIDGDALRLSRS